MNSFYFGNYYLNFNSLRKNNLFVKFKKHDFYNSHLNKKFLILGTGPSLFEKKDIIIEFIRNENPIVIAVNNIPNDFKIDYRIFLNRSRFANYSHLITNSQKCLLSPYFKKKFIYEQIKDKKYSLSNYKIDKKIQSNFRIDKNIIVFKKNPNTGFVAIIIAYLMGSININIAGIDGYHKNIEHHYYNESNDPHDTKSLLKKDEYLILLYQDIKDFLSSKKITFNSLTGSKYNQL